MEQPLPPDENGHEWRWYEQWVCCKKCGIVRRKDGGNKPCRGIVKITLREKQ